MKIWIQPIFLQLGCRKCLKISFHHCKGTSTLDFLWKLLPYQKPRTEMFEADIMNPWTHITYEVHTVLSNDASKERLPVSFFKIKNLFFPLNNFWMIIMITQIIFLHPGSMKTITFSWVFAVKPAKSINIAFCQYKMVSEELHINGHISSYCLAVASGQWSFS